MSVSYSKAYNLYQVAKDHSHYTAKDIAAIIDFSSSRFNKQIHLLKYKPEKCQVMFLHLVCEILRISLSDMISSVESELSIESKLQVQRVTDFVESHSQRLRRLSEKQRTAFYPSPLPKSFLQVTTDRLN